MASRTPPPPATRIDSQCGRCGMDLNLGEPPAGVACIWVVCPQCKIRFWQEESHASILMGVHGIDEAAVQWRPGFTVH